MNSPASRAFSAVAVADINHDGKLDLVADGTCVLLGKAMARSPKRAASNSWQEFS